MAGVLSAGTKVPYARLIGVFLGATALFIFMNQVKTPFIGIVGIASVMAWSLLSAYLRGPLLVAVALGLWTGVIAVATSMVVGVEPFKLDASTTKLIGPWSFVTWPAVGAFVCGMTALTLLSSSGAAAKTALVLLISAVGVGVAFGAAMVPAGWNK